MLNDWSDGPQLRDTVARRARGHPGRDEGLFRDGAGGAQSERPRHQDKDRRRSASLWRSVATPASAFHAEAAVKQGASRDEILETIGLAIYMGAGPSVMYAAKALEAFDQFASTPAAGPSPR